MEEWEVGVWFQWVAKDHLTEETFKQGPKGECAMGIPRGVFRAEGSLHKGPVTEACEMYLLVEQLRSQCV